MSERPQDRASELRAFARFLVGLPRFVRLRMTVAQAKSIIQDRLRHRQRNFLAVVERGVFANPGSPYRKLLDMAGCSLEDIKDLLPREGLEATLTQLRQAGVYVSFEEFKVHRPIVSGSTTIETHGLSPCSR